MKKKERKKEMRRRYEIELDEIEINCRKEEERNAEWWEERRRVRRRTCKKG